jgi:hypothetical protein
VILRALAAVLLLGACVGSGPAAETQALAPSDARVLVHVEFVPPLLAPGQLRIAHECGERLVVTTGCTSVDLRLPPGPVAFVLQEGGTTHEFTATVAPGMAAIVWNLGTATSPRRPGGTP